MALDDIDKCSRAYRESAAFKRASFHPPEEIWSIFAESDGFLDVIDYFRALRDALNIDQNLHGIEFYEVLKSKLTSWKCQSLWDLLNARLKHAEYKHENKRVANNLKCVVIGAGPIGLRSAIESLLLGCRTVVVEKRKGFTRNNVLHLWPFLLTDFRALGAKKFYGKFGSGCIEHINIKTLQTVLLKVALVLGVEVYSGVEFKDLIEPTDEHGWKATFAPDNHELSKFQFDIVIGADGKKNVLPGFTQVELRGSLAIGITCNFINRNTEEEKNCKEISGISYQFKPTFFKDLKAQHGVELENIVYYKDETHYFVMTAVKASLLNQGVLLKDYSDPSLLVQPKNIDKERLKIYTCNAVRFATTLKELEFKKLSNGQSDIALFDFTSLKKAENACRIFERKKRKLLIGLVGDSLIEPFWPTGSGCGRGVLSALDLAWMVRQFSLNYPPLAVIRERENVFKLLSASTHDNIQKNYALYTIDPKTRYSALDTRKVQNASAIRALYDTDDIENADLTLSSPGLKSKYGRQHSTLERRKSNNAAGGSRAVRKTLAGKTRGKLHRQESRNTELRRIASKAEENRPVSVGDKRNFWEEHNKKTLGAGSVSMPKPKKTILSSGEFSDLEGIVEDVGEMEDNVIVESTESKKEKTVTLPKATQLKRQGSREVLETHPKSKLKRQPTKDLLKRQSTKEGKKSKSKSLKRQASKDDLESSSHSLNTSSTNKKKVFQAKGGGLKSRKQSEKQDQNKQKRKSTSDKKSSSCVKKKNRRSVEVEEAQVEDEKPRYDTFNNHTSSLEVDLRNVCKSNPVERRHSSKRRVSLTTSNIRKKRGVRKSISLKRNQTKCIHPNASKHNLVKDYIRFFEVTDNNSKDSFSSATEIASHVSIVITSDTSDLSKTCERRQVIEDNEDGSSSVHSSITNNLSNDTFSDQISEHSKNMSGFHSEYPDSRSLMMTLSVPDELMAFSQTSGKQCDVKEEKTLVESNATFDSAKCKSSLNSTRSDTGIRTRLGKSGNDAVVRNKSRSEKSSNDSRIQKRASPRSSSDSNLRKRTSPRSSRDSNVRKSRRLKSGGDSSVQKSRRLKSSGDVCLRKHSTLRSSNHSITKLDVSLKSANDSNRGKDVNGRKSGGDLGIRKSVHLKRPGYVSRKPTMKKKRLSRNASSNELRTGESQSVQKQVDNMCKYNSEGLIGMSKDCSMTVNSSKNDLTSTDIRTESEYSKSDMSAMATFTESEYSEYDASSLVTGTESESSKYDVSSLATFTKSESSKCDVSSLATFTDSESSKYDVSSLATFTESESLKCNSSSVVALTGSNVKKRCSLRRSVPVGRKPEMNRTFSNSVESAVFDHCSSGFNSLYDSLERNSTCNVSLDSSNKNSRSSSFFKSRAKQKSDMRPTEYLIDERNSYIQDDEVSNDKLITLSERNMEENASDLICKDVSELREENCKSEVIENNAIFDNTINDSAMKKRSSLRRSGYVTKKHKVDKKLSTKSSLEGLEQSVLNKSGVVENHSNSDGNSFRGVREVNRVFPTSRYDSSENHPILSSFHESLGENEDIRNPSNPNARNKYKRGGRKVLCESMGNNTSVNTDVVSKEHSESVCIKNMSNHGKKHIVDKKTSAQKLKKKSMSKSKDAKARKMIKDFRFCPLGKSGDNQQRKFEAINMFLRESSDSFDSLSLNTIEEYEEN